MSDVLPFLAAIAGVIDCRAIRGLVLGQLCRWTIAIALLDLHQAIASSNAQGLHCCATLQHAAKCMWHVPMYFKFYQVIQGYEFAGEPNMFPFSSAFGQYVCHTSGSLRLAGKHLPFLDFDVAINCFLTLKLHGNTMPHQF